MQLLPLINLLLRFLVLIIVFHLKLLLSLLKVLELHLVVQFVHIFMHGTWRHTTGNTAILTVL